MSLKEYVDNVTVENQLPLSLQKSINNIIKKEGYETYKVDIKLVSTNGDNYLAYLYEIDVQGKTTEGEKTTNLFVKAIKQAELVEGIFSVDDIYVAEGYFYKDLSKVFEDLENQVMVPLKERFNVTRSYEETDAEAIILENLAKKGFKTLYRMDVPSLKFVELCMQEIAKLHAFSYIIQKRNPKYFCEKISSRKSVLKFGAKWEETALNLAKLTIKYCDSELKKKVENFLPVYLKKMPQYYTDQDSSICCLCHSDFRLSNTLTRETNGEIEKVILIDYQLIHYGCPVNDFLYFMYSSTDRRFRSQHLEHIKDVYHNTLRRFLKYFDMDVEEVYPRKEFERVLDAKKEFGIVLALYFSPIFFVTESAVPDFGDANLTVSDLEVHPRGRERFLEIAEEFWGLKT